MLIDMLKCMSNFCGAKYSEEAFQTLYMPNHHTVQPTFAMLWQWVNIHEDLDRAIKWFKENKLHFNVNKTKWSLLDTYQKICKAVDITINVGNAPLEQVSEYKYLGTIT